MKHRLAVILSLDVTNYSASMSEDASGTLANLQSVLKTVVRPALREFNGRIVKLMGDGALAEFSSAQDAIRATSSILKTLKEDEVQLRAGIHVGDISVDGDDVFGDAVNIASRLQAMAKPRSGLVSRVAAEMAGSGIDVSLKPEGALRLKGFSRPVEALSLDPCSDNREALFRKLEASQEIRFVTASDGVRLAWTAIGEGPPLMKAPNWIQHLELDWQTMNAGWLSSFAEKYRLVRFDQRGNGLSDRGAGNLSLERFAEDLKTVMDAARLDRVPLLGKSQGASIALAFATKYPERVSAIVTIGGFAQGALVRSNPHHVEFTEALNAMGRVGWDDDYPSVRDHFARILAPDASEEDQRIYAEAMREMITSEDFAAFRQTVGKFDVTDILPKVRCPVLVIHAAGDRLHPLEQARRLAAGVPDGRFVAVQSRNHGMPHYDPAWPIAFREIENFLAQII